MRLSGSQRGLMRELVEMALEMEPDDPESVAFGVVSRRAIGGGGTFLIHTLDPLKESRQFKANAATFNFLETEGFVIPLGGGGYRLHRKLLDVVEAGFLSMVANNWIAVNINHAFLVNVLQAHYDQTELNGLCIDLGIDSNELGGTDAPLSVRIDRLVRMVVSDNRLGDLLRLIDEDAKGADWRRLFDA